MTKNHHWFKNVALCLLFVTAINAVGGNLFEPNAALKQQLLKSPDGQRLVAKADAMLKQKPINPHGTYGVANKANEAFWPRVVGIPMIDWMETLGYAYLLTGDRKYVDKGISLLTATCRDFPASMGKIQKGLPGARGHILYGIALGGIFFGRQMTPEQLTLVEKSAAAYIDDFLNYFGNPKSPEYLIHNHNALSGAPAGLAALYFKQRPGFSERLDKVIALLEGWSNRGFDTKGLYIEGAGYARYGSVPRLLIFAWQLREAGGKDLFKNPHFRQWPYSLVETLIPGSNLHDTRGDNDYDSAGLECLFLAVANHDPLAMWLWEQRLSKHNAFPLDALIAAQGTPVAKVDFSKFPLSEFFPVREFALWRTGWSNNDVLFSIEAGAYGRSPNGLGGTHAQSDKGHFCLYAFGDFWAVDSGYANDSWHPHSRSNSFAHNLILIDGKGQAPMRVDGHVAAYFDSPTFGYSRSDLTSAYNCNDRKQPGAVVRKAERQTLFIRPSDDIPAYAVVLDDIDKDDNPHLFSWMMMVPADKTITYRNNVAILSADDSREVITTPAGASDGSAIWRIKNSQPEKMAIWLKVKASNKDPFHSDSFYLVIDDNSPIRIDFEGQTRLDWMLYSRSSSPKSLVPVERVPIRIELPQGEHKIAIKTREREACLSDLYLAFDDSSPFTPSPRGYRLKAGTAEISGGMVNTKLVGDAATGNRCLIVLDAAAPLKFSHDCYLPPNPRPPQILQRLRIDTTARNPYFAAVLLPLKKGSPEPEISFHRDKKSITLMLDWKDKRDIIRWQPNSPLAAKINFTRIGKN